MLTRFFYRERWESGGRQSERGLTKPRVRPKLGYKNQSKNHIRNREEET